MMKGKQKTTSIKKQWRKIPIKEKEKEKIEKGNQRKRKKNRKWKPKKKKKFTTKIWIKKYEPFSSTRNSNGSNKEKLRTFYISRTFDISLFE